MSTSPWYREGTAKFTQGSTTVTGTGTRWVDFVRAGDGIQGPDGNLYQIMNVASNTSLSISPAYGSETTYWTIPIQGYVKRLADAASQLVRDFEGGAVEALDAADRAKQSATEAKVSENKSLLEANRSESEANRSEAEADRAQQAADDAVAVVTGGDASIEPEAGKIPLAGSSGTIKQAWVNDLEFELDALRVAKNKLLYGDGPYPVLDFQFQGAKMLDPRIQFARGSTATYTDATGIIRTAEIDEPRFTYDPASGEAMGLLVEGQATNLALWSQDFSKSVWVAAIYLVVDPDSKPSPVADGCFLLRHTGGSSYQHFRQTVPTGQGDVAVRWIVARGGASRLRIAHYINGISNNLGSSDFNFDTGAFIGNGLGAVAKRLSNDWWEFTYSITHGADATDCSSLIYPGTHGAQTDTDSIYLAAYGIEEGSQPTSYIPTEGSQVTRAADTVSRGLGGEFNPREGTFVFNSATFDSAGRVNFFRCGTDTISAFGLVKRSPAHVYRVAFRDDTIYLESPNIELPQMPSGAKIGFSWSASEGVCRLSVDGVIKEVMDISPIDFSIYSGMEFSYHHMSTIVGATDLGQISKQRSVTYYPRSMSDTELQELTK